MATALIEGLFETFVSRNSKRLWGRDYGIYRLVWDLCLSFGTLFLNIMDLLINKFVFNDYYDLYLEYMIIFNGFIGFYQLSVFAMGYIIDIISKLV